jgi:hypothetical protein
MSDIADIKTDVDAHLRLLSSLESTAKLLSNSRALGNVAEQDSRDHGDVAEQFQSPWKCS